MRFDWSESVAQRSIDIIDFLFSLVSFVRLFVAKGSVIFYVPGKSD